MIASRAAVISGSHAHVDDRIDQIQEEAEEAIRETEKRAGFGGVLVKLQKQEARKDEVMKENSIE